MRGLKKLLSIGVVVAMLFLLMPAGIASAAALEDVSDILSSNAASTTNVTHTVYFTIPTGGSALTASSNISISLKDFTVASTYDGTATVTDDGASVGLDTPAYSVSGDNVTIDLNASIAVGSLVKVVLGGSANASNTIDNPVAGIYTVTVTTSGGDSGSTTVAIEADAVDYQFGIDAGSFVMATANATLSDITLAYGKLSTILDTTWQAADARGSGAGWHITVNAGSLSNGTKTMTLNSNRTFADNTVYAVEVLNTSSDITQTVASDGSTAAGSITASNASYAYITSGGETVVSAASDQGMGRYTVTPHFRFTIPFGAYADGGTNYSVTMTIDVVTGA